MIFILNMQVIPYITIAYSQMSYLLYLHIWIGKDLMQYGISMDAYTEILQHSYYECSNY